MKGYKVAYKKYPLTDSFTSIANGEEFKIGKVTIPYYRLNESYKYHGYTQVFKNVDDAKWYLNKWQSHPMVKHFVILEMEISGDICESFEGDRPIWCGKCIDKITSYKQIVT